MVRYADGVQTTPQVKQASPSPLTLQLSPHPKPHPHILRMAQPDGTVVTSNIGYSAKWLASKEVNFTAGPHRLPPPA